MPSFGHIRFRWLFATLVLGWVTLAALLSPAVVRAQDPTDRSGELQQLVDTLGQQLAMQSHFNRARAETGQQQLSVAIKAWAKAGRTDDDFELMHDWLTQALQASLAGSKKPLPPLPEFSKPQLVARRAPATPATPPTPGPVPSPTPRLAEELPMATPQPQEDSIALRPTESPTPTTRPQRPEAGPEPQAENPWSRHPAATPLDLGNPFVDDPPLPAEELTETGTPALRPDNPQFASSALPRAEVPTGDSLANARVVLRPTAAATTAPQDSVGINLAALAARIRGHDRGLRGIEARLIANPQLREEELLLLAKELEAIVQQRRLIDLYVEALNPAERARVTPPESAEGIKRLIAERAKRLRGPAPPQDDLFDEVFSEQPSPVQEEIKSLLESI